ncbi:MAG: PD-(D/E)XK nuclease family protein [Verrucomicrobiales bacterium]
MPVMRHFLSWEAPFLDLVLDFLWARREELAEMVVVVPTAQSGRLLRRALLERAAAEGVEALLSPRVVTPSFFLKGGEGSELAEELAWVETLETTRDWRSYEALFPQAPGEGETAGWSLALARSLRDLRRDLVEEGLTVGTAARKLAGSVEGARWEALARLEWRMEAVLETWGRESRPAELLAAQAELPEGFSRLVLAGVTDAGGLVRTHWRALASQGLAVEVLIGAPAEKEELFDDLGHPTRAWAEMRLPAERVHLTRNAEEQAEKALSLVAEGGRASDELALGAADAEVGPELVKKFTAAGWPLYDPANAGRPARLSLWLGRWRSFLAEGNLGAVADLLECVESGILVRGRRAQKACLLEDLRVRWLVETVADLRRVIEQERRGTEDAGDLLEACEALERWRGDFQRGDFAEIMGRLLEVLGRQEPLPEGFAAEVRELRALLDELGDLPGRFQVGPGFWLEVLAARLSERRDPGPEERVLEVRGWVELLFSRGWQVVVCGMNEGVVPRLPGGDSWLVEGTRERLGMPVEADRTARDACLLTSLVESRREDGQVDFILGKTRADGEMLQPSRLLLAVAEEDLPERVGNLFRALELPESGSAWERDFQWEIPAGATLPDRLNITALPTYLLCPFRYYLSVVKRMGAEASAHVEWDQRQFGSLIHEVLEAWGRDEEAREFSKTEAIEEWVWAKLDDLVTAWFGEDWPLAIRLQADAMKQRLSWFARTQACLRAEGWRVEAVEKKIEEELGEFILVGKVDRIDRHEKTGAWRILDYKTGKVGGKVESVHLASVTEKSPVPAHLAEDERALYEGRRWRQLQLALYAGLLTQRAEEAPELGYFALGDSEAGVKLVMWEDYEKAIGTSALACARMIAEKLAARVFWPPAEKGGRYDDFQELELLDGLEAAVRWREKETSENS